MASTITNGNELAPGVDIDLGVIRTKVGDDAARRAHYALILFSSHRDVQQELSTYFRLAATYSPDFFDETVDAVVSKSNDVKAAVSMARILATSAREEYGASLLREMDEFADDPEEFIETGKGKLIGNPAFLE